MPKEQFDLEAMALSKKEIQYDDRETAVAASQFSIRGGDIPGIRMQKFWTTLQTGPITDTEYSALAKYISSEESNPQVLGLVEKRIQKELGDKLLGLRIQERRFGIYPAEGQMSPAEFHFEGYVCYKKEEPNEIDGPAREPHYSKLGMVAR